MRGNVDSIRHYIKHLNLVSVAVLIVPVVIMGIVRQVWWVPPLLIAVVVLVAVRDHLMWCVWNDESRIGQTET